MKRLLAAALLLCGTPCLAATSSVPVVEYLIDLANVEKLAQESVLRQAPNEPELQAFGLKVMESIDLKELARQESALINRDLSPDVAQPCIAFVGTPLASKVLAIVRKQGGLGNAVPELEKLPAAERRQLEAFVTSSCFQKALGAITSPAFLSAARRYGERLACAYVQTDMPEKLQVVRAAGHCLDDPR